MVCDYVDGRHTWFLISFTFKYSVRKTYPKVKNWWVYIMLIYIREMIYVWHRSVCYGLSETSPRQRWYIGLFPDNNNVACTENTIRHLEQILAFIQLMKHAVYHRKIIPSSFFASYTPLDTHRLKSVQPSKFTPHVYLYLESYSVDHSHR